MSILDKINSSNDIKKLSTDELEPLCAEMRQFLIESLSHTGGHLASNLGAVELSVAIHRVYDSSKDRLVFDVGHQSYCHKIITGRKDGFENLRKFGGISGFPKPHESNDDAFVAGHASNSMSVALGMAKARTLTKSDYDIVAIIGDGALTGGLAYEGLVNIAGSGESVVVILNDNNMSISKNVGGMAKLLQDMRLRSAYLSFKRWYREKFSAKRRLYRFTSRLKEKFKRFLLPQNLFEKMGLYYLGPVDGHDVHKLENVIRWARDMRRPVLLHVLTDKGKGYKFAEEHPDRYHGVGRYNVETGELEATPPCYSNEFGKYLCEFAQRDDRIAAITAAMTSGTGIDEFAERFPERFFDMGIAEGHAVTMAAGMAKQGMIPVFAVYSSFLQRGYDMLIHDVALQNLHVVFAVDRAGLVGSDGETHHGAFDVAYLSSVPGMTILAPASFKELHDMLEHALFELDGPVAIRYPRGGEYEYKEAYSGNELILREGRDISIVAYGPMISLAIEAARTLAEQGISPEVIKLSQLKPCSFEETLASVKKTGRLLVAEDCCAAGCVGEKIVALAAQSGIAIKAVELLNLGEGIVTHGETLKLLHCCGLDAAAISSVATEMCKE